MIEYAKCTKRFVIEPCKYYTFVGEEIYHDTSTGFIIHFDSDGNEIYRKGESAVPSYPCKSPSLKDGGFLPPQEEVDFEYLFNKCLQFSDYLYEDIENLKSFNKKGIVIGGCGRSGTTLLNSIMGAHKDIHAIEEETYSFVPTPRLNRLNNNLKNVKENFWCEKTPKNIYAFHFLAQFDFIKLIHIVRDCRDVILSHHPNHKQKYWVDIERWNNDVQTGLSCFNQCLTVKYEDLILDTKNTLQKICDHIEVDFDENMLNYQNHTNLTDNVAWGDSQASAVHAKSINKWKNTEDKDRINEVYKNNLAVNLLKRLNYVQ